jgi:hypothetical protein
MNPPGQKHQLIEKTTAALTGQVQQLRARLNRIDAEALARQTGFVRRTPRKIPLADWLAALVALATERVPSLEGLAGLLGCAARTSYSKQALHKRLRCRVDDFLAAVAAALLGQLGGPLRTQGLFGHFQRVLLQDSTALSLPDRLARDFPGSGNQRRRRRAGLKLQFVCDLLSTTVLHLSLSGFTRNDQAAAPDVLKFARRGDLLIRDLGYFVLGVFQNLALQGIYFLSRYRHGIGVFDAQSGRPLDLAAELKAGGRLDREVLLGEKKVRVRLVAQPVPEAVANERRRKARANRDRRLNPSTEKLFLLGWNIFITNVPRSIWPAAALVGLYRLRWRIEVIFKAWKSHLGLTQFNRRTAALVRLSVLTKLLFCLLVYAWGDALELLCDGQAHVSLLRLARILGECACLLVAAVLEISPEEVWRHRLAHHLFYEPRKDRKNFYERLAEVTAS